MLHSGRSGVFVKQSASTEHAPFAREIRNSVTSSTLNAPAPYRPGLDVSLLASVASDGEGQWPVVVCRVAGAMGALRVYLYVDGDFAETWAPASELATYDGRKIPPGRHIVTVRAIDAVGRWGGASIIVEVTERKAFAS
jgi:hypothetical protein